MAFSVHTNHKTRFGLSRIVPVEHCLSSPTLISFSSSIHPKTTAGWPNIKISVARPDLLLPPSQAVLETKGRIATLGMFIIDQFEVTDPDGTSRETEEQAIGGGGVYAMMGARLFLPPPHIGLVVDRGDDFPLAFEEKLGVLGEGVYWRRRQGGTTRALNVYSGGAVGEGHQSFRYLRPSLQIHLADLVRPPSPFAQNPPEWLHVVVRHPRARDIIGERDEIGRGEAEGVAKGWRFKMIWEPLDVQGGERLGVEEWCRLAAEFEVVSPNLLELQHILGIDLTPEPGQGIKEQTESAAAQLRASIEAIGRKAPVIVVRVGKEGSYTLSEGWTGWTPAYWQEEDQGRVLDPTGGGNGFLGGFGAGMILSGDDVRIATMFGSAAASFMIQQRGLPAHQPAQAEGGEEGEKWNGADPWARVRTIAGRMKASIA